MGHRKDSDGPPLGNYGNSYAPPGQDTRLEGRAWALSLRERLWSVSSIPDLRKCGRVPMRAVLPILQSGEGARLTGLCRCHSVWCCPVCAPEIRASRGFAIGDAVARVLGEGGGVCFGTGTLSHSSVHSLRSTYSLVVKAWAAVTQDKSVRSFRKAHGHEGFIRTCEVTYGDNGWHPHMHWLEFWSGVLCREAMREYRRLVTGAWSRAVERLSDRRASSSRGVVLLPVSSDAGRVGNYLTEMAVASAAFELTSLSTKRARRGGLSPFEILGKVYGPTSHPFVDLWWEYEQATRGRRMLGASRGLLSSLGLSEADPLPEESGVALAYVRSEDWSAIRWFTTAGLDGVQLILEEAAVSGGQVAVDRAVSVLLGVRVVDPVTDDGQGSFDWGSF